MLGMPADALFMSYVGATGHGAPFNAFGLVYAPLVLNDFPPPPRIAIGPPKVPIEGCVGTGAPATDAVPPLPLPAPMSQFHVLLATELAAFTTPLTAPVTTL